MHVIAVTASVSVAYAQRAESGSASSPANKAGQQSSTSQAPAMTMPHPAPEMQRLVNALSGTWSISEQYESSERMPNGGVGEGEEVWRSGPGGLSLIEEHHSKNAFGEISGMSLTSLNGKAQGYRAIWGVNTNPVGCVVGKKFTFKEVVSEPFGL